MSKACATPSRKIKKHNKFSLDQRSETGSVCKLQSYLTDIYTKKHVKHPHVFFEMTNDASITRLLASFCSKTCPF